jgi:hypothetical protein
MKTWKTFIAVVCCCGLAVGYGLIGCDDQGDADHAVCQDNDGDGYGNPSSAACVHSGLDCDDTDEDVYPNATELCDGIDNQCPGDSKGHGMVDADAACLCSFDGGSFIFTVGEVVDNCPVFDIASLFPPGGQVGPVELPGFQDLRETIIPFGPPIGTVSVSMFSRGKNIRFELRINATATLIGVFCPRSPDQIDAAFTVDSSCYVLADGIPAGG